MADAHHVRQLEEGTYEWNRWRYENGAIRPDLGNVDLMGADLFAINFENANLVGANLYRAQLRSANLNHADLTGANLEFANLSQAHMRRANLVDADLRWAQLKDATLPGAKLMRASLGETIFSNTDLDEADLSGANLKGTIIRSTGLREANFQGATVWSTTFVDLDLSRALGLESCDHMGPSSIDFQTFARSGRMPIRFLRGCGLPETLITFLPSLLSQGIEFHSCFISYSTSDHSFVERLHADLQDKGVRCWFAPHDMQGGRKIREQIDAAIQLHDRLLLILSEASMDSHWVRREIVRARKRERQENRRMLFPLGLVKYDELQNWECFEGSEDLAREVREYFIPDFCNWKNHDSYQKAFDRLLKDLRQNDQAPK